MHTNHDIDWHNKPQSSFPTLGGLCFLAAGRGVLQQPLRAPHGVEELLRQRRQRCRGGGRRGAAVAVALGVHHLADLGEAEAQISSIGEKNIRVCM